MYSPPIGLPADTDGLRRAIEAELYSISGVLQAIGNGQLYPHSPSLTKKQYWDHIWQPFSSGLVSGPTVNTDIIGANDPVIQAITGGVRTYCFPFDAMKELFFQFAIGHDIRRDTTLIPYVQWVTMGTNTGTVRWGIEYTIAKSRSQGTFPASTTIYMTQAAAGTTLTSMLAEATDVISTNVEPDSVLAARVFRDVDNDTCTDSAGGLVVGFHYLKGHWATKNKAPDFYV